MKGTFKPKNPHKYKGDPSNIVYRSSWELTCMVKFDNNPNVIEWSSEEVQIPYRSKIDELIEIKRKLTRKRWHRYFVDFYVKVRQKDGSVRRMLIEVKPKHETAPPDPSKYPKNSRRLIRDQIKWEINSAKWKAAKEWAKDRNMIFEIFTEDKIYGKRD